MNERKKHENLPSAGSAGCISPNQRLVGTSSPAFIDENAKSKKKLSSPHDKSKKKKKKKGSSKKSSKGHDVDVDIDVDVDVDDEIGKAKTTARLELFPPFHLDGDQQTQADTENISMQSPKASPKKKKTKKKSSDVSKVSSKKKGNDVNDDAEEEEEPTQQRGVQSVRNEGFRKGYRADTRPKKTKNKLKAKANKNNFPGIKEQKGEEDPPPVAVHSMHDDDDRGGLSPKKKEKKTKTKGYNDDGDRADTSYKKKETKMNIKGRQKESRGKEKQKEEEVRTPAVHLMHDDDEDDGEDTSYKKTETKTKTKGRKNSGKEEQKEEEVAPPAPFHTIHDDGEGRLSTLQEGSSGGKKSKKKNNGSKKASKNSKSGGNGTERVTHRMARNDYAEDPIDPTEEEGDDESSTELPGATQIQGMRRGDTGSSNATISYSNNEEHNLEAGNNVLSPVNEQSNEAEHLVVATLAPDIEIVEGTPMEENKGLQLTGNKLFWLVISFVVVTSVVVGLVLGLDEDETTGGPTIAPTLSTAPTTSPAPTAALDLMDIAISRLAPYISGLPIDPVQQQALDWLIENDGRERLVIDGDVGRLLDRYVLAILFFAANGEGWQDKEGWITEVSVCNWDINESVLNRGSMCPSGGDRVNKIFLANNNLQGTIPSELGALTELTELWLHDNSLTGSIPSELGQLTILGKLHVVHLMLEDEPPLILSACPHKVYMYRIRTEHLERLRLGDSSQYKQPPPESVVNLCETTGLDCDGFYETSSPTMAPTDTMAPTYSMPPTGLPTAAPSTSPTTSASPSGFPSMAPSTSSWAVCPESNRFHLYLTLDSYPGETSWDIKDLQGEVVQMSPIGGYEGPDGRDLIERGCLEDGTYTFTLYDSYGDGLFDPGSYKLSLGGIEAFSGGHSDFSDHSISIPFSVPLL